MSVADGGPAFPSLEVYEGYDHDREVYAVKSDVATGMSLRDYFAAQALAGLATTYAQIDGNAVPHPDDPSNYADVAFALADAMLKAREATHGR